MSAESIVLLFDELLDYVTAQPRRPRWEVTTESTPRGFGVTVFVGGAAVVEASAREVGSAHRRALEQFRAWADDQPSEIAHALEVSVETARAEAGR